MINEKWDMRFLLLAGHIAQWSRDPSRQVGAVIVRPNKTIVSVGYNGFARGVEDLTERYENREIKYEMVVHAEVNAISTAGEPLTDCTLYSTLMPCSRCMAVIINAGIKRVVTFEPEYSDKNATKVHFDLSKLQAHEAGVEIKTY